MFSKYTVVLYDQLFSSYRAAKFCIGWITVKFDSNIHGTLRNYYIISKVPLFIKGQGYLLVGTFKTNDDPNSLSSISACM